MSNTTRTARIPAINTNDVRALRERAHRAADAALVARCDRALAGEQDAWWLVRTALAGVAS